MANYKMKISWSKFLIDQKHFSYNFHLLFHVKTKLKQTFDFIK